MRQSQSRSTKPWSVPLAHPLDSDMFHVVSLSLSVFVASPCCTKCVAEACFGASFCVPWGVRLEETGEGCGGESWLTTQWLRAICGSSFLRPATEIHSLVPTLACLAWSRLRRSAISSYVQIGTSWCLQWASSQAFNVYTKVILNIKCYMQ